MKEHVDVKAFSKSHKSIIFKLPGDEVSDESFQDPDYHHPTLHATLIHFSPSHYEGVFTVHYRLDVYIKHQSKTEFGMGNFVSFPIKIKSMPLKLPMLKEYQQELLNTFAFRF